MSEARDYRYIGRRIPRPDGPDKVTGRAHYGADLHLPGMLFGRLLRSPHAHARLLDIDILEAAESPGVLALVTGADLPELTPEMLAAGEGAADLADLSRNCLAKDKVLYHGHAVAAVAATSQKAADEALAKIKVKYEPLPVVLDVYDAMREDAPLLHDDLFTGGLAEKPARPSNIANRMELQRGDVAKGFAAAELVIEREFRTPTAHQGYIEPHACTVRYSEDGQSMIWSCTQGHFQVRNYTARLLGMDLSRIKSVASEIGGGFGGKTTVYLEPVAMLLSRQSGRPVQMSMTREEVLRATGPGSASRSKVKIGATRDGTITAMEARLYFEAGAFKGSPMQPGVMCAFAPYDVENAFIEGFDVVVNKPKVAAYRAPGAPQAEFGVEMVLNELAVELGMDPLDLRLKNAVREGSQALYGPKFKRIGFIECLEAARASPHYQSAVADGAGRGVAAGFWFNAGMQSSVVVNMNPDGSAVVVEGSPDIGGSRASIALMAAEELGIPVEKIKPVVADTESIGDNSVTGGSRTTFATGMAVVEAAQGAVRQMKERAAAVWNVTVEQVHWEDGVAVNTAGEGRLTAAEICASAGRTGGPISAAASLNARGAGPSFAVHLADVSVDRETGFSSVLRYTAIQDAGKAIHPDYVEGQFQGGAAQGIGWALNEEYVYSDAGVLENASFLDYRIPLASDLPMIETQIIEVPNPFHPYGVRGVGETGIVPPMAAVGTAVSRAIGSWMTELPLSPPRLLSALLARDA